MISFFSSGRLWGVCGALALAGAAGAEPIVLDADATINLFDEGGPLDYATSAGHLGALEALSSDEVFVLINKPSLGVLTTGLQLVRSAVDAPAQAFGPEEPIAVMPWAADLTAGPDLRLYVAGEYNGSGGIFGLDPNGFLPVQTYAIADCAFSTTGLTFAEDGSYALVSTDGSQTTCSNGLFRVSSDGVTEHLIQQLSEPDGIPRGTDDHAVMNDGRVILAGDKSHDLWDVTGGAGTVFVAMDLDELFSPEDIPGWAGGNPVFGSRVTVDPVTGDLFYSHGTGAPDKTMSIIRVRADFSGATLFAEGFALLRDLDFAPAGPDNSRRLFVTELRRAGAVPGPLDTGHIYAIDLPADQDADRVPDFRDNCMLLANEVQRDTDGDGFGNRCDPDLDGNGVVNVQDLGLLRAVFFSDDSDADLDGDGIVNAVDLGIMKQFFFLPPGPGASAEMQ